MAKKQKIIEAEAEEAIVPIKKKPKTKKMKYHPVAHFRGCKNCE